MALSVNNNLMALTAFNNLTRSYGALSKSVQKLSSGLRINGAADDAAGLAVRELMRSDIAVLNQGVRNANDAISLLQTMDGAASVIDEKLIRMKELAEQAATGTYSSAQRSIMNDEFVAMRNEIERIAQATDFNGIKLLNGASGTTTGAVTQVVEVAGTASAADSATTFVSAFNVGITSSGTFNLTWTDNDGDVQTEVISVSSGDSISTVMGNIDSAITGFDVSFTGGANAHFDFADTTAGASEGMVGFYDAGGTDDLTGTVATTGVDGQSVSNVKIHFGTGNDSNEDYYYIQASDMTASGLGISDLAISTQHSAQAALTEIDQAILSKDTSRASWGATMNRLENTVTNLTIQAENIAAGESQISDVDVAKEMTAFVNNQIKAQAAVAMLAQANTMPQMAMSLLQGG